MAINTKTTIRYILLVTGIAILVLGIILFAAGFMVKKEIENERVVNSVFGKYDVVDRKPQIWAGLPVLITGALLIVTAAKLNVAWLNIISAISLFLSMVLLLAVIVAEAPDSSWLRRTLNGLDKQCENLGNSSAAFEMCKALKAVISWHNAIVYLSDIILFLCLLALLAVFANVMLVTVLKEQQPGSTNGRHVEMGHRNQACTRNVAIFENHSAPKHQPSREVLEPSAYTRNVAFSLADRSAPRHQPPREVLEPSALYQTYSKYEDVKHEYQSYNANAHNGPPGYQ